MLFTKKSDVNNSKTVICLITHILIFTSSGLYKTQSISLISMDNLTSSKRCLRFLKETIYNLSPLNFREFDVDELPCQARKRRRGSIFN